MRARSVTNSADQLAQEEADPIKQAEASSLKQNLSDFVSVVTNLSRISIKVRSFFFFWFCRKDGVTVWVLWRK